MPQKDLVICLRAVDYSETSQVVTFYGRAGGKFAAMAKGAKRAKSSFGGPIERFAYGTALVSEREGASLGTLHEFEGRYDIVVGLSRRLYAYHCGLLAAELVDRLTEARDPHPGLFDRFLAFLRASARGWGSAGAGAVEDRRRQLGVLIGFQLALLAEIGWRPVLDACVNCGHAVNERWPGLWFSHIHHGLVCRDCEATLVDRVALPRPVWRVLVAEEVRDRSEESILRAAEALLVDHFSALLRRRPKAAAWVLAAGSPGQSTEGHRTE